MRSPLRSSARNRADGLLAHNILAEFEGMTMAEIAEALDVNPNTISSRLRAARRELFRSEGVAIL